MKQKFKLSKSNKIYFLVVAAIFTAAVVFVIVMSDPIPPDIAGIWAGLLLRLLLIPLFFTWIVWLLSGKKENAASWTFNIVLTLMLLAYIGILVVGFMAGISQ